MKASALKRKDEELKRRFFEDENPPYSQIESFYWQTVESAQPEIDVPYAADLKTHEVGSGFPTSRSSPSSSSSPLENEDLKMYVEHPWNLTRLAREQGSLLASYHRDVAGVTSPWLYVGVVFSTFCWHTEDNYFAACNYHHWGAPKVGPTRARQKPRERKDHKEDTRERGKDGCSRVSCASPVFGVLRFLRRVARDSVRETAPAVVTVRVRTEERLC